MQSNVSNTCFKPFFFDFLFFDVFNRFTGSKRVPKEQVKRFFQKRLFVMHVFQRGFSWRTNTGVFVFVTKNHMKDCRPCLFCTLEDDSPLRMPSPIRSFSCIQTIPLFSGRRPPDWFFELTGFGPKAPEKNFGGVFPCLVDCVTLRSACQTPPPGGGGSD